MNCRNEEEGTLHAQQLDVSALSTCRLGALAALMWGAVFLPIFKLPPPLKVLGNSNAVENAFFVPSRKPLNDVICFQAIDRQSESLGSRTPVEMEPAWPVRAALATRPSSQP